MSLNELANNAGIKGSLRTAQLRRWVIQQCRHHCRDLLDACCCSEAVRLGWNQESNFEEFASALIRRARLAIRREKRRQVLVCTHFLVGFRRRHSSPRQFESLLMLSSSSSLSCHNFKKAHFCRRRLKAFLHTKVVVLIPLTIASKSSVVCSILFR